MEQKTIQVDLGEGVSANVNKYDLTINGSKGEVTKTLANKQVTLSVEDNKVLVNTPSMSKKYKKIVNTFVAHIKNMIKGSQEGFVYKLKICSGHFPMNVSIKDDILSVKNLFGEKIARELKLKPGSDVKIDGEIITVQSNNKEIAGQVAADIEKLTRRPGFDNRIFQDGIYITEKAGKKLK